MALTEHDLAAIRAAIEKDAAYARLAEDVSANRGVRDYRR
jgi:hypothetical protein